MASALFSFESFAKLADSHCQRMAACLAQSVERQPFKLVVVGSSPTVSVFLSNG
jgi:hypothetical protein